MAMRPGRRAGEYGEGVADRAKKTATVAELLSERVRRDGPRPLVTFLRADTGERMELSAASLANAVAKTAGLLRDDLDAEPGDAIAMHLPLHWQAAVWWGACAATSTVCAPAYRTAGIGVTTAAALASVDGCAEQVVVSLAPFGLPDGAEVPATVTQAAIAARAHPDVFTPWAPPTADDALLDCGSGVLTNAQCLERASALAESWGVHRDGRLMVTEAVWPTGTSADADVRCIDAWLALLAVPLVADAAVVLVAGSHSLGDGDGASLASIATSEKITASMPTR